MISPIPMDATAPARCIRFCHWL